MRPGAARIPAPLPAAGKAGRHYFGRREPGEREFARDSPECSWKGYRQVATAAVVAAPVEGPGVVDMKMMAWLALKTGRPL